MRTDHVFGRACNNLLMAAITAPPSTAGSPGRYKRYPGVEGSTHATNTLSQAAIKAPRRDT